MPLTLGLDFGTNTVRALLIDARTGDELAACTAAYPSGDKGVLLDERDPHLARQHPGDWLVALEQAVKGALAVAGGAARGAEVVGIGVDGTGSTPLPVDASFTPLGMLPAFRARLEAQAWLWKDHTAAAEAAEITALASRMRPQFLAKCGGTYSSEWFWSKILHCARTAPDVFEAAASWVELTDFVPAVLCGVASPAAAVRTICCAGHKALYHEAWGGLPDEAFLGQLDPRLAALRGRLYARAVDLAAPAGRLCPAWAGRLGIPAGAAVAVGLMDVHYGAIGCGVREGVLVKAIGTSTCDCAVGAPANVTRDVPGICGMVPGSILPGMIGIEAGQSAVGDIFAWWVERVLGGGPDLHRALTEKAARLRPGESGLLALDWNNGNRTVLVDPHLTGLVLGQTLHTRPEEIYRALLEATAFGARVIVDRLREYGVPVRDIVCCGGIAEKNPLLMQIYADVLGCELQVAASSQACALGAAIGAAVAAGVHPDVPAAQARIVRSPTVRYRPDPAAVAVYARLLALYEELHDAFGGVGSPRGLGRVMKELLAIRREVAS